MTGDQNRDQHPTRGGQAHHGEERDAQYRDTGQGDDYRSAGEHDRASCGADGQPDRFLDRHSGQQLTPMSGEDEQAVVDAAGQAEHERDRGRCG